jgi:prepilin-type N-terminal cleavage/methylation domain-containing protein
VLGPRCRALRHAGDARVTSDAGMSLVELLVAIFIFGLIAAAVGANVSQGLTLTRTNRERSVAANLAAQELDVVRNTPVTSLPLGLVTSSQTVDSTAYAIRRTTGWVTKSASVGSCDGGSGARQAYLRVNVKVTWAQMSGVDPVNTDTLVTPKLGSFGADTGAISVKVRDRDGAPESGAQVSVSGPGVNSTQTTADDGCAFFAFLPAGTYTASASTPNFVDLAGRSTPSTSVAVVAGTTAAASFDYDREALLVFTLQGPDAGHPAAPGLPVRLGNSNGAFPYGVTGAYPGTGNTATAGPLFPFASGYTAWAGDCADADPGSGARGPAYTTDPGTNGTGTLTLPGLDVTARSTATGLPLAGVTVVATHASEGAPQGCSSARSYPLPGTTDALGVVRAALPYGTWALAVSGQPDSGTVTLAPGAPVASATVTG